MIRPVAIPKHFFFGAMLAAALWAQVSMAQVNASTATPEFGVVSIRRVGPFPVGGSGMTAPRIQSCTYVGDRVKCVESLEGIVEDAYQVKRRELSGPQWLDKDVYALEATMPPGTAQDTARLMLQRALMQRFGLLAHHEQRTISVYGLITSKHGAKLQEAATPDHRKPIMGQTPMGQRRVAVSQSPGRFYAEAITIDYLADILSTSSDLPVVNLTGLTGQYRIDLNWDFTPVVPGAVLTLDGTGLRNAIPELGLQLEKRQVSVDTLVIDQINRTPSEN